MPEISQEQLQGYLDSAVDMAMLYVPKVLLALVVLIIGLWFINRLLKLMDIALEKAQIDVSLARFLHSLASAILKILLVISVASMIGIATTSFVAVLGAASLAIGLALQGSLANFAGGVLILLFKPYRVGDFIEAQGVSGTVREIQIFSTYIHTPDNKVVIVPNGALSNNVITNFSKETTRRIEIVFGVGYNDDITKAKDLIQQTIANDERIHTDPAPLVAVSELADNSVNITTRVWVNSANLSPVRFDLIEQVKRAFDNNEISIPYPQRDLHVYNHSSSFEEPSN